jgi:hypothetical protein
MNTAVSPPPSPALEWNLSLLDEAIARIEADPEHWKQTVWRCGSGCCLAGHVALAAGAQWAVGADDEDASDDAYEQVIPAAGGVPDHVADYARTVLRMPNEYVCTLLGDVGDYRDLFSGSNSLEDIKGMARDLHAAQDAAKAGASR